MDPFHNSVHLSRPYPNMSSWFKNFLAASRTILVLSDLSMQILWSALFLPCSTFFSFSVLFPKFFVQALHLLLVFPPLLHAANVLPTFSDFFIYHRNTSIRHLRWALKVHFLQQLPFKIQAHYCLLASYTAVRSRNNLTYWQWKATGPFFFNSDQSVNLRGSYTWYTFNHNHPISCNPAHHPAPSFPPKKSRTTCGSFKIPSVRAIILTRYSLLCPHIPTGITRRTTHLSFYFQVFMCPHLQFCSQIHAPMPFRPSFPIVCCLPCSFKRFQNLPAKISSFIHLTLSQDSCFPHRSNNRNPDTAVETELCSFLSGA